LSEIAERNQKMNQDKSKRITNKTIGNEKLKTSVNKNEFKKKLTSAQSHHIPFAAKRNAM
jgi:hypothetical protein